MEELTGLAEITGQPFDISFSVIMAALVFSAAGWWLYQKGRREDRLQNKILGWALMLYSYITPSSKHGWIDWAVGFGICGIAYYFKDQELI